MAKIIALAIFLLNTTRAFGMCVTSQYDPVAWNDDGSAVVLHVSEYGPEGGGSNSYQIIDFKNETDVNYTFSSDFSPGDGSTPQSISIDMCRNRMVEANQTLEKLGFKLQFKGNCIFRSVTLPITNGRNKTLEKNKVIEIGKIIGFQDSSIDRLVGSSKDGIHFILIEDNDSCSAKCHKVIFNQETK